MAQRSEYMTMTAYQAAEVISRIPMDAVPMGSDAARVVRGVKAQGVSQASKTWTPTGLNAIVRQFGHLAVAPAKVTTTAKVEPVVEPVVVKAKVVVEPVVKAKAEKVVVDGYIVDEHDRVHTPRGFYADKETEQLVLSMVGKEKTAKVKAAPVVKAQTQARAVVSTPVVAKAEAKAEPVVDGGTRKVLDAVLDLVERQGASLTTHKAELDRLGEEMGIVAQQLANHETRITNTESWMRAFELVQRI
jgi:hypothetical protein